MLADTVAKIKSNVKKLKGITEAALKRQHSINTKNCSNNKLT